MSSTLEKSFGKFDVLEHQREGIPPNFIPVNKEEHKIKINFEDVKKPTELDPEEIVKINVKSEEDSEKEKIEATEKEEVIEENFLPSQELLAYISNLLDNG